MQRGIQLRDSSGQLGKCVFIGFVQQIAVLCRLDPALNGVSAQDHRACRQKDRRPDPGAGKAADMLHKNAPLMIVGLVCADRGRFLHVEQTVPEDRALKKVARCIKNW